MPRTWTLITGLAALTICAAPLACSDDTTPTPDRGGVTDGPVVDDASLITYDVPVQLDSSKCPPVPSCNWCGGKPKKNAYGCTVGFVCANGVDPCTTPPCTSDTACKPSERCGKDKLCWPRAADGGPLKLDSTPRPADIGPPNLDAGPKPKDAGPPMLDGAKVTCPGSTQCSGSSAGDCSCEWSCSDGKTYKVTCKPAVSGGMSCQCLINTVAASTCSSTASGTNACAKQQQCCGFPF